MSEKGMAIIGAGEAGGRAAIELREQGWKGPITLIGKEGFSPYERPPLSKGMLISEEEPVPKYILDEMKLTEYDIRLLSDRTAACIDRANHAIHLADGREVGYERLLLATGASPRKLTLENPNPAELLYLRSFHDALAIRSRLRPNQRIVVIGGGFIGLEVAASAREKGCSVILLEVAPRILMRGVPREIASIVESRHRQAGVEFYLGVAISGMEQTGEEQVITLADGTVIASDTIIVGIGAVSETSLAEACGLEIENGVRANEFLTTSDPDIYTAGDCCSFPHGLFGGQRIRLEAWRNAQDQGIHAARNMLGASERYEHVPWFWSDQYEQTLMVAGLPDIGTQTVQRESGEGSYLFFHLNGEGRLVGASGIGTRIAKDIRLAEILIERQARPDPSRLGAPDTNLKDLL